MRRARPAETRRRTAGPAAVAVGFVGLAAATWGMLAGREPFSTWYYPLAWLSTLLAADGVVALRTGRFHLLERPRHALSLAAWSAVLWLVFELANLRLRNWYYVFVPAEPAARWAGVLLSFATVLPAVFLSEAVLRSFGVAERIRRPARRVPRRFEGALAALGVGLTSLALLAPRWAFPLIWIGPTLVLEAFVHGRDPSRSLLADLEAGRPGRVLRLLAGGATIGLLWELFNARARGKWIYTVPGFEELKLFEMPIAGFLGFPPFALECHAAWQALVLAGVAVPRDGTASAAGGVRRALAVLGAVAIVTAGLAGMERMTMASTTPTLADVPGAPAARLHGMGLDVWSLAEADPRRLAREVARSPGAATAAREAERWVERARLLTLRGIGARGADALAAAGVASVEALATADPARLARALRAQGAAVPPARVRVWVRAARADAGSVTAPRGGD